MSNPKIIIAATFTADPVREPLDFWLETLQLPFEVELAPYHQVFQHLLDPTGSLTHNRQGLNVLLVRFEDWLADQNPTHRGGGLPLSNTPQGGEHRPTSPPLRGIEGGLFAKPGIAAELATLAQDLVSALKTATARSGAPYLLCFCPPSSHLDKIALDHIQQTVKEVIYELAGIEGVYTLSPADLHALYPVPPHAVDDAYSNALGHIPYTPTYFTALGTMLARRLLVMQRPPAKVIVLDCDHTLWGGVCAEDGPQGVDVAGPWHHLQTFMVAQSRAGRLLCLCSKNQEADVQTVFNHHPEMPLRPDHIVASRINWQPKSENIQSLAQELQLGLDSFIFLDDNPLECAEVRANCPQVLTLQLPKDPAQIPQFLAHVWAFDSLRVTGVDRQRTALYRQQQQREQLRTDSLTYADFLAELDLTVKFSSPTSAQLERVAQLTQRTNQFNATTLRRSAATLRRLWQNGAPEMRVVHVSDRFGDYGLVGVIFFTSQADALRVDTFLLSCRALGRGVEHQMLAHLGELAAERGLQRVDVPYTPTERNRPVLDFLTRVGSDFKIEQDDGLLFRFSARAAAQVTFTPPASEQPTNAAPSSNRISQIPATDNSINYQLASALQRIATDLTTVAQIEHAVKHHHRRARAPLSRDHTPPQTAPEKQLAALWCSVLDLDRVGARDNFFDLGGNSLRATRLASQIQTHFGCALSLQDLFYAPVLAKQAKLVARRPSHSDAANLDPISPHSRPDPIPLSFAQQRLWFLRRLQPDNAAYNISFAIRLTGSLDVTALARSLAALVHRHESLRTIFPAPVGKPAQQVLDLAFTTDDLSVVDLRSLPAAEREQKIARRIEAEARRHFDLTIGPLFFATLLQEDARQNILLLTMPHIITDSWSMHIFFQELSLLYQKFETGSSKSLPDLPLTYIDFTLWQRRHFSRNPLPHLDYWQQQLVNLPILHLPTDQPRPAVQTFQGAVHIFSLSAATTDALRALCRREETTLFMTLLALFQTLLHRYTGQADIPVGAPVANRHRPELENLVGLFVNTLVLRGDLSGNPDFRTLLRRIRQTVLEAQAHQDLPFDLLVDALQPERDPARSPLFQVMFSLQNEPSLHHLNLPGLTATRLPADSGASQFDLSLEFIEDGKTLTGWIEYNTDLFDAATIVRLAGHLQTLVEAILADPDQPLSQLPLLTPAERQQVLVDWNGPAVPLPPCQNIVHLFEAQAARTPDAVAVIQPDADNSLTYDELNQQANRLARYLQARGAAPEIIVGLCVERSLEMVVGLLAILKTGAAYLPLDPDYPPDRLAFMLADTQAPLLLTRKKIIERLSSIFAKGEEVSQFSPLWGELEGGSQRVADSVAVICFDADGPAIARQSAANLAVELSPEHLAYVMYTSGSTGRPKGVMIEQRSLAWYAQTAAEMYGLTAADRILQFSSISFDISVEEIYPCLIRGAALVLRSDRMRGAAGAFLAECRQWGLTALFLPTTFWHELAGALAAEPWHLPESLRLVSFGGEEVQPERVSAWRQTLGERVQLMNGYGPTETTVVATLCQLIPSESETWSPASIGRVIPGALAYILDENLQPVPIGVPGELYLGGVGVARGYLNRPDLTAQHFIPNPFVETDALSPSPRLYKSGDVARFRPDGQIEYLGRADQQVKIQGFRVEPAEIENILARHPAVQAAAVAVYDDNGPKRLVAYIVPFPSVDVDVSPSGALLDAQFKQNLRQFLETKVPAYMLPAAFVALEALPLTPNGKVDRCALPPVDMAAAAGAEDYVAPRHPVESALAEIWGQVLGLKQVGVYDNFFELGGDSILTIQIIARAGQAGLRFSPGQIFQHQTIAALAEVVDTTAGVESQQGLVTGPVVLTPIQRWFFEQALAQPHHWTMPALFEIDFPPDPTLLAEALNHLARHHDALRLRFEPTDSARRQFNAGWDEKAGAFVLEEHDLSAVPEAEREVHIRQAAARMQAALDLSDGPLCRAGLFHAGPESPARLLLVVHHLAVDAVSWQILQEDLNTAYEQLERGEPVRLPPKTTSFQQWAEQLQQAAQPAVVQAEIEFWRQTLPDQAAGLPLDHPHRQENVEADARAETVSLDRDTTAALLQAATGATHARVDEILLAALAQTLAEALDGDLPLLIDLEGHGREELAAGVDVSRTVGWFTMMFPVCLDVKPGITLPERVRLVRQILRNVPRRGLGYGLLRYLGGDKTLAAKPQARISFNYLGRSDAAQNESVFRLVPFFAARAFIGPVSHTGSVRGAANRRSHLLEIEAVIAAGALQVAWVYNETVHRPATIAGWANRFIENLQTLIAYSHSSRATKFGPVEEVYPLSPLQRAMQSLAAGAPESREFVVQWFCRLRGPLDVDAFQRTWQTVVNRHPALRTAFDPDQPVQRVRPAVHLEWEVQDWRAHSAAEQQASLQAFLAADRARGFDLAQAPLLRLALFRLGVDACQFVWSHHHLILDGWSTQPLWQEVWYFYHAFAAGESVQLPPPPPYRAYIEGLQARGIISDDRPLDVHFRSTGKTGGYGEQQLILADEAWAQVRAFAQNQRITLNTLMQGVWALVLHAVSGQTPVYFWAVVSDRSTEIEFEAMVGLLLNIIPVQVDVPSEMVLEIWLKTLQKQQLAARQSEGQDRANSVVPPPASPLFNSVLRFQNYPLNQSGGVKAMLPEGLGMSDVDWMDRWPYPLNLEIVPGESLLARLSYQKSLFTDQQVRQMLSRFEALLETVSKVWD